MYLLVGALVALSVMFGVYARAKARGEWSWPAFSWTLLILLVGCAVIGGVAYFVATAVRDPLIATLFILAAVALVIAPVTIFANRIYRHYVKARG